MNSPSLLNHFCTDIASCFLSSLLAFCGPFLALLCPFCDGEMKTVFSIQHVSAHRLMQMYNNKFSFDVYSLPNNSLHLICFFDGYGAVR